MSVNIKNYKNMRHFSSPPSLQQIGSKSDLWCQVGKWFSHWETQERKKSLSRICAIGVLLPMYIFPDFKWFLHLKVKLKRF